MLAALETELVLLLALPVEERYPLKPLERTADDDVPAALATLELVERATAEFVVLAVPEAEERTADDVPPERAMLEAEVLATLELVFLAALELVERAAVFPASCELLLTCVIVLLDAVLVADVLAVARPDLVA